MKKTKPSSRGKKTKPSSRGKKTKPPSRKKQSSKLQRTRPAPAKMKSTKKPTESLKKLIVVPPTAAEVDPRKAHFDQEERIQLAKQVFAPDPLELRPEAAHPYAYKSLHPQRLTRPSWTSHAANRISAENVELVKGGSKRRKRRKRTLKKK